MTGPAITSAQIIRRRIERHGLRTPVPTVVAAAVAAVGIHAQIMSAAETSAAIRTAGATRADVRAALADGTLTKTFGPRGTVHLLPTAELGTWLAALSTIPVRSGFAPGVRLDEHQRDDVVAAIAASLGDEPLTVDELDEAVVARLGDWAGERTMPAFGGFWPRWRQAITLAAHRGVLAFGPDRGRLATYRRPLVPQAAPDPLRVLIEWFLRAYGPSTPAVVARWLATPEPPIRAVFEHFEPVRAADEPAWVAPGDTVFDAPEAGVVLLPHFDAYAVGAYPRETVFPGRAFERALNRGQAGNYPVILVDGVVRGVWHQRRSGTKLTVTAEVFIRETAALRAQIADRAERIAAIQEARLELVHGPVTVGPHA